MAPLILYKLDMSPPSCAVMALGEILGLNFEFREPNFMKMDHKSPEFLKVYLSSSDPSTGIYYYEAMKMICTINSLAPFVTIDTLEPKDNMNPLGTIPVLIDGTFNLVDSHAISAYMVTKYGSPEQKSTLYPTDLEARAVIDQRMYFDASVLFIRLKVVALPTVFSGMTGPSPQHIADIEEAYGMLEAFLDKTKYIAANHLTIADLTVGASTQAIQGIHALDQNKFPKTQAWIERLESEQPSFKKIITKCGDMFGNLMTTLWNKNKSN